MNKQHFFSALALTVAGFIFNGCCNDPAIVKIPASDGSAPILHWEVTVLTQTPAGPISSLTQHANPTNNLTVHTTDEVGVYLVATDNESGVKKIGTQGGFSYTCTSPGPGGVLNAAIIDGFLPKQEVIFSDLTTCGLKQWKIKRECLNVSFSCNSGTISNRSAGMTGTAENFKGEGGSINLTIEIVD